MKDVLAAVPDHGGTEKHPLVRTTFPGIDKPLICVFAPVKLSDTRLLHVEPSPVPGADTVEILRRIGVELPVGSGLEPYPPSKPAWIWAANLVRWGYFALRSGQI